MHHRSQLDTEIFNDGTKDGDVLNSGCGADFVKVNLHIQINLNIESYYGNQLNEKKANGVFEAPKDSNCGTKGSMIL